MCMFLHAGAFAAVFANGGCSTIFWPGREKGIDQRGSGADGRRKVSTCKMLGVCRAHMTPCTVYTSQRFTVLKWHTHICNRQKTK